MAQNKLGRNIVFPIKNADGTSFNDLVLRKAVVDSVVMSLGDKITGDVYYKDNSLNVTMREYIEYKNDPDNENEEAVKYFLVNPPTIVREGMVSDNGDLKGMTKYSFEFYHPMYMLANLPFSDVAVNFTEEQYLSQNKSFSWIGKPQDYINKLNKNLEGTEWVVAKSQRFPIEKDDVLSEVLTFDNNSIADALKTGYDTWEIPYIISTIKEDHPYYAQGKRFLIEYGLPSTEVYENETQQQLGNPYIFRFGQGVGLKNNSRTPRNNKIVTRIAGYGSEDNIPYGYPQIPWYGNQDWEFTINNQSGMQEIQLPDGTVVNAMSYPIYEGIVGGKWVKLIKHPFTRNHLMPSIYSQTVFNKVSPYNSFDDEEDIPAYNQTLSELKHTIDIKIKQAEDNDEKAIYNKLVECLDYISLIDGSVARTWNGTIGDIEYEIMIGKLSNGLISGSLTYLTKEFEFESVLNEREYIETNPNYNPNGEIIDYYDAISDEEHTYTNEINILSPSYDIHEFEKIKPELGEQKILNAVPLNANLTEADQWDDTIDDNGDYVQSYFRVTLPILSFDLYACAAITQEMQVNMRSGTCIGCTFDVQVDWEDYKRNFYNEDGDFLPDGEQRNLIKYPKSNEQSISVILQKEYNTFGTIMPNIYQQPQNGDQFVFLGISLPFSYIEDAQQRLDEEMKSYMLENNMYYFDYPLKFDQHFLAVNTYILKQIHPNSIIRFNYADQELSLFVKQLTIKYGDSTLPQYDITLTDDIEVVLNQIGQVAEEVNGLSSTISLLRQSYSRDVWGEINKKLSKTSDDIAQGLIGFTKGLWVKAKGLFGIDGNGNARLNNATMQGDVVSDNFQTGWEGSGYALIKDADGVSRLEVDELMIRRKLMAREVEIQRETYIGGLISVGDADGTIYKMTPFDSDGERMNVTVYVIGGIAIGVNTNTNEVIGLDKTAGTAAFYRCYFVRSDDETKVKNRWKVGDMARCDEWDLVKRNGEGDDANPIGNRFYWRLVINTGTELLMDADGVEREYIFIDLAAGYSERLYSWPAVNGDCYVTQTSTPPSPISPQPPIYGYSVMVWPSAVNSDIPAVGDHVVQNGYVNDKRPNRQSIIKIGYNGSVDGTKEFNVFEQIGKDKTSAATQYRYPNNPIKLGSEKTSITADEINFRTHDGLVVPVNTYRGTWTKGTTAYKGEEWTYNGQTYVCKISSTTTAPDASTTDWQLKVAKGTDGRDGQDGTSFTAKGDAKAYWLGDDQDLTDWMRDYGEDKGAPLGTWLTDRGQVFVFDAYDATPTEIPSQDGDAYVVFGDVYDTGGATGTRYVQELLVRNGYRWVNLGKIKGTNGTDGLSFVLNPSTIIINETLDAQEQKIYSYSGFIGLSVLEGDTAKTYRITDASMYGEDLLSIEITSNGLRLTDGDDIRITQFVSDAILIHVLVNNKTYELTVPVIVNRAGTSFLTLKDGLAAIGVESMRTVLTTDPVAEQVVVNYVKNGLVVTDDKVQLAMWVENLIMAGVTARQVGNDYYLDFKGQRFNFYDTRNPQNPLLRMFISNGLLNVVNPLTGNTQIEFGLDENNNAVLKYYDAQGNYLYNLGPGGLQMLGSQALGMRTRKMAGVPYDSIIREGVWRDSPRGILLGVAWAKADDLHSIAGIPYYEMQYKMAAGVYVPVTGNQHVVEITDYDESHTSTVTLTLDHSIDITREKGEMFDHKWLDGTHFTQDTPEPVLSLMGGNVTATDTHLLRSNMGAYDILADESFRLYSDEGIPSDYTDAMNAGEDYCKGGVERNYTEVNFSQTVYVRRLRYFREGLEVAHLDIYFNL